jgi:hypothetical protein
VGGSRTFTLSSGPSYLTPADDNVDIGAVRGRLRIDQLDSVRFPRSGYAVTAEVLDSRTGLGARDNYTRWEADLQTAVSSGDNTVQFALKGGGAIGSAPLPVYDQFSFGGFLRLSGYRTGQFYGDSLTFGRLMYYRKLSKAVLTEGTDYEGISLVYVGASLIILSDGDAWQVLPKWARMEVAVAPADADATAPANSVAKTPAGQDPAQKRRDAGDRRPQAQQPQRVEEQGAGAGQRADLPDAVRSVGDALALYDPALDPKPRPGGPLQRVQYRRKHGGQHRGSVCLRLRPH